MVLKSGTGGFVWTPTWLSAMSAIFWPSGVVSAGAGAGDVAGVLAASALRASAS
jgi:hypothetical protein